MNAEMNAVAEPAAVTPDAIGLLIADHDKTKALFSEYQGMKEASPEQKFEVAKKVCGDLLIHMAIEEGIFYPAVRNGIKEKDLVDEAECEHEEAKNLIRELGDIKPDDPVFEEKMQTLSEKIQHHVREEENEMFPKVRSSGIDIDALGRELYEARNEMRTRLGLEPGQD